MASRAAAVSIAGNGLQLLILLGATAVLARLLTPRDFGLLAMAFTLVELATTFRDLGLASATVQRADINQAQMSALFWRSVPTAALVGLLLLAGGPVLAAFYGPHELIGICAVLSVGVALLALTQLHLGLLRRQMRFAMLSVIDVGAVTAGAVAGIGAALLGAGYWALVVQQLVLFLVQSGALWGASRWRPSRPRDSAPRGDVGVREMLRYGRFTASARFVSYLGRNADQVIIGRVAGTGPLGLYKRAFTLSTLPFTAIYTPISKVAQSSLSRLQHDPPRYRQGFRTWGVALFGVTLPATAFLVVAAEDAVLVLLGDQWVGAIDLLRILAAGAFFWAIGQATKWLYLTEGRTREQFVWSVVATAVTLAGVAIGAVWGTTGVAAGYAVSTGLLAPAAVAYCLRGSRVTVRDWGYAVIRPAVAAAVGAVATLPLIAALDGTSPFLRLAAAAPFFGLVCLAAWALPPGGRRQLGVIATTVRAVRDGGGVA